MTDHIKEHRTALEALAEHGQTDLAKDAEWLLQEADKERAATA